MWLALVIGGCLAVGAAPSLATTSSRVVRLAGTTVIRGSHSTSVEVSLAKPVLFATDAVRAGTMFRVSGRGRIVGVLMTAVRPNTSGHLSSLAFNYCYRPGCRASRPARVDDVWQDRASADDTHDAAMYVQLAAGRYHLELVADGAPVSVTLRFPGLAGRTTVRPSRRSAGRTSTLRFTDAAPVPAAVSTWSGGLSVRPRATSKVLAMVSDPGDGLAEVGLCVHEDAPPPAYVAGCPGGNWSDERVPSSPRQDIPGRYLFANVVGPGRWSAGVYRDGLRTKQPPAAVVAVVPYS
jgi:hypothetical protein